MATRDGEKVNTRVFRYLFSDGNKVFVDDIALKICALNENPPIKGTFGSAENPMFELFYIDAEEVITFSFTERPKTNKA